MIKNSNNQYVSFFIQDQMYGFNIHLVKEVNPNVKIFKVPLCKKHIRGLVNIRGEVVLVMDIAVILGYPARPVSSESQLIILKTQQEIQESATQVTNSELFGNKPVGFLADKVGDVIQFEDSLKESSPHHLKKSHSRFIEGVLKRSDIMMVLLNATELIHFE